MQKCLLIIGSVGAMLIPFGLVIELVGNRYKTIAGLFFKMSFPLGEVIIGLLAIGVRDYVTFQWILAIPCLILAALTLWIIPESPRWLINKKKYKEAKKVVQSAAKFNKVGIRSFHHITML